MPGSLPSFHLALCHEDRPPIPSSSSVFCHHKCGLRNLPVSFLPLQGQPCSCQRLFQPLTQPPARASLLTAPLGSSKTPSAPGPSSRPESHLAPASALAVLPTWSVSVSLTHQVSGSIRGSVPLMANGPLRSLPSSSIGWLVPPASPALFLIRLRPVVPG